MATIADSAGGYAGFSLFPPRHDVLASEFKIHLLAPAKGRRFVATGRVVRPGKTLTVCEFEVRAFASHGEEPVLCATGLQTLVAVKPRD